MKTLKKIVSNFKTSSEKNISSDNEEEKGKKEFEEYFDDTKDMTSEVKIIIDIKFIF